MAKLRGMKTVALALVLLAGTAHAHYKCTAPNGAVTYQQSACPITQKQQLLFARPAAPEAAAEPLVAPVKPMPALVPAAAQRERRPNDVEQTLTSLEARFERLKDVRAEIDEARKLAAR